MEFLGIGWLELLFIFFIILMVAGPKDIQKTALNLGRWLNRLYRSPNYQVIRRASEELRNLPARLAREAQLDELKELQKVQQELEQAAKGMGQDLQLAAKGLGQDLQQAANATGQDLQAASNGTTPVEPGSANSIGQPHALEAWVKDLSAPPAIPPPAQAPPASEIPGQPPK